MWIGRRVRHWIFTTSGRHRDGAWLGRTSRCSTAACPDAAAVRLGKGTQRAAQRVASRPKGGLAPRDDTR